MYIVFVCLACLALVSVVNASWCVYLTCQLLQLFCNNFNCKDIV